VIGWSRVGRKFPSLLNLPSQRLIVPDKSIAVESNRATGKIQAFDQLGVRTTVEPHHRNSSDPMLLNP
jgi:hypothetical protein